MGGKFLKERKKAGILRPAFCDYMVTDIKLR